MTKKIEAKIVADSICNGNRITSYILTYPRFIHAELMTHRMFSRNSASSRAIPFEKMVKMVEEDPFIPIAWQKDHKGMQGTEYITSKDAFYGRMLGEWIKGRDYVIEQAKKLNTIGVTKQLCNRLLEPFMWHTVLVTATEWENFFELRCPRYEVSWYPSNRPEALEPSQASFKSKKDAIKRTEGECSNWSEQDWRESNDSQAEIHIQTLAEAMWDAMNESIPKELKPGEWHIPFGDKISYVELSTKNNITDISNDKIKIATARCARLSYMTFEGKIDYEKDIALHDQLLAAHHMSPFEHCARAMSLKEVNQFVKGWREEDKGFDWLKHSSLGWCNNFRGWIPYRYLIDEK